MQSPPPGRESQGKPAPTSRRQLLQCLWQTELEPEPQPGRKDADIPREHFYTLLLPLCNCSVPNPSPCLHKGRAGGSPGHPRYSPVTPHLRRAYAKRTGTQSSRELPARTRTAAPRGEHPARALQTQLAQTFTCLAATAGIRTGLFSECFSMSLPCATCTEMFVLAIGQIF